MQTPDALRARLQTAWSRNRHHWLAGSGQWPLSYSTQPPTEAQALADWDAFDTWLASWRKIAAGGVGRVIDELREWNRLGQQNIPCAWRFDSPLAVADALGQTTRWQQAGRRFGELACWMPMALGDHAVRWRQAVARYFDLLADISDADFQRLQRVVEWLWKHPASGLYARQLPIAGVDSKWLESRRAVVAHWLAALHGEGAAVDFHQVAGLRSAPDRLRMRVLDPGLRAACNGLSDVEAPLDDFVDLRLPVRHVLIVENLYTGLALGDLPGTLAFMRRGYAVEPLATLPWLAELPITYWGDIDTHGLAILSRLRGHLPHVRSLMMDTETLRAFQPLWGEEDSPHPADMLPHLTAAEQQLYRDLRQHTHGIRVRLEQERIAWDWAWARLIEANPAS